MLHMLTAALAASTPLTNREILSGVWGSISLASWVFLLVRRLPPSSVLATRTAISPMIKALTALRFLN